MNNAASHLAECHSCWKMVRTTVWGKGGLQTRKTAFLETYSCVVGPVSEMAHSDTWEGKWRGKRRMGWVSIKHHMTAEHSLSSMIQTPPVDTHKHTHTPHLPVADWTVTPTKVLGLTISRKTKSGFCVCYRVLTAVYSFHCSGVLTFTLTFLPDL